MGWVTTICLGIIVLSLMSVVPSARLVLGLASTYLAWTLYQNGWLIRAVRVPLALLYWLLSCVGMVKCPDSLSDLINAASLPSASKRTWPILVKLEGGPGAGKTYSLDNIDWQRLFGQQFRVIEEKIPDSVMTAFYSNIKTAGIIFEHYMVAIRMRDEDLCRSRLGVVNICDRTLVGSFAFHITNYILGYYNRQQIQELFGLQIVSHSLSPVVPVVPKVQKKPRRLEKSPGEVVPVQTTTNPEIVIVYYATSFEVCHERVIRRAKADAGIEPRYHEIVTFVYAYLAHLLALTRPDIGFLVDVDFATLTPGRIDYNQQRGRVLELSAKNLEITLHVDEKARFEEALQTSLMYSIDQFVFGVPTEDKKVRGCLVNKAVEEHLNEVRRFRISTDAQKAEASAQTGNKKTN